MGSVSMVTLTGHHGGRHQVNSTLTLLLYGVVHFGGGGAGIVWCVGLKFVQYQKK